MPKYEVRAVNLPADPFLRAYLEAAEWAGISEARECGRTPFSCDRSSDCDCPISAREAFDAADSPHWSEASLKSAREDCEDFQRANADDLADLDAAQAGHDFYLTRNRHGAGFWDRGLGEVGERLTAAAHVYGETYEDFDAESGEMTSF